VSTTEISDLIAALRAGQLTLEELADRFRLRRWVISRRPAPATYLEMAEQEDPAGDVPGSFDEVTAAYDRGEITREEYRVLAHAAAEAINAQAAREADS
jgi:predicted RNA-binding protein associated with RNAse of E/G family